jgi:hypothetical protein
MSTEHSQRSSPVHHEESSDAPRPIVTSDPNIANHRPVFAKRLSSHFLIPLANASVDSSERVGQSAVVADVGPPSPVSMKDARPDVTSNQTLPKDALPMDQFGDTLVRTQLSISQKQWQLQRSALARHSVWFKQFFEKQHAASNGTIETSTLIITEIDGQVKLVPQDGILNLWTASRQGEDWSIKIEQRSKTRHMKKLQGSMIRYSRPSTALHLPSQAPTSRVPRSKPNSLPK